MHLAMTQTKWRSTMITRHPKALSFLFLTEMWERFGFYIVQGLLVLYMTEYFGLSDSASYSILGTYTALVYLAPLGGGYLASNYLGFKKSILFGGFLLILGYAILAFTDSLSIIYPALAIIIVGNGFLKPNISSLLGSQYKDNDPRRDAGFTIFYIGINIGALLAGLSSGYIKEYYGWRASFLCASVGLVIGMMVFLYGRKYIVDKKPRKLSPLFKISFLIACLIAIVCISFLMQLYNVSNWLLPCAGIVLLIYLGYLSYQQDPVTRAKLIILNFLFLASIIYWTLFFQLFSSANLFVERLVDMRLFGVPLSASVFWGSESIFIILLGPFFAWLWHSLAVRGYNPSAMTKFFWSLICAGIAFLILSISTSFANEGQLVAPAWVFLAYFVLTLGELLLSPIGLSAVTTLAPKHLVGFMMGVWFVSLGFGGIFSGMIAKFASIPDTIIAANEKLAIYQHAFFYYACLAFIFAILLFFVNVFLKRYLPMWRET